MRGCLIENSGEIMKEAICHISCCMVAASLDVPSQRGDRLPFFHALPALLMLQTTGLFYIVKKQNNPLLLLEMMPRPEHLRVACVQGLAAVALSQLATGLWVSY